MTSATTSSDAGPLHEIRIDFDRRVPMRDGIMLSADVYRPNAEGQFPVVLLRCARPLPADAQLRLVWGQGIESQSGVPSSQDQVLEFQVRPSFSASFSCERVSRDANCLAFLPMRLSFSAPIARTAAEKMVLRAADGKAYRATLPDPKGEGDFVQEVTFKGSFPEQATFKLEIPGDLRDDAGRKLSNQKRFPLTVNTDIEPPLVKFPADRKSVV